MSEQTVNVALNVSAQGNAKESLRSILAETRDLVKAEHEYQEKLRYRNRLQEQARAEQARAKSEGGTGAGGGSGLMTGFKVYASIAMASSALNSLARGADLLSNASASANTKFRGIAESIPIIGGLTKAWFQFTDAIQGTLEALRQNAIKWSVAGAGLSTWAEVAGREDTAKRQFSKQSSAANFTYFPFKMLESPWNERAFHYEEMEMPAMTRLEQSRAGKNAAIEAERWARGRLKTGQQNISGAESKVHKAEKALLIAKEVDGGADKVAVQRAEEELAYRLNELQVQQNRLKAEQENHQQRALDLVRAESEARKATIGVDQARLAVLKEQEGILRGQAHSFGMMTHAERALVAQAARQAKTHGFASLIPSQKALLQRGGFGTYVDEQAVREGEFDPRLRQAREDLGIKGNLTEIRKQRVELQNTINLNVQLDEQKLAEEIARQLGEYITRIEKSGDKEIETAKRKRQIEEIRRRSAADQ